jgi:hypothetical protein
LKASLLQQALDLNMGYDTISLDLDASKICTIKKVLGQWEWQILQTLFKMELMESLEYARAYLDDLLCISRNSLEYHLEKKLDEVLRRLCDADLKVNADNRHSAHLKNA